jgi:hypothetical protein
MREAAIVRDSEQEGAFRTLAAETRECLPDGNRDILE